MRFLMILALISTLLGCNMVEETKNIFEKREVIASSIEEKCGKKPQVGFEYSNGVLTYVEVLFSEFPEASSKELYAMVNTAVVEGFQDTPQSLKLSFSVAEEN